MYDVIAGKENMESSYLMTKGKALETFPMLKSDGLVGALVYYDGGIFSETKSSCAKPILTCKVSTTMHE